MALSLVGEAWINQKLQGYGAFDFLRTYDKKPFLLEDHIDRLLNTAKEMALKHTHSKEELTNIVHEGIRRSKHPELYIKLILTGGVNADGISPGKPSLICLFLPAGGFPAEYRSKGVALQTVTHERYLAVAKSLNYMAAVVELQRARAAGFQDVLYIGVDGAVLEGTTVNFFIVRHGKLYTADEGILYGCTRKHILRLARELGIECVLGKLNRSDLATAEEAFISSTTRELHPVVRIDAAAVGTGAPGPVTLRLMSAFEASRSLHP